MMTRPGMRPAAAWVAKSCWRRSLQPYCSINGSVLEGRIGLCVTDLGTPFQRRTSLFGDAAEGRAGKHSHVATLLSGLVEDAPTVGATWVGVNRTPFAALPFT